MHHDPRAKRRQAALRFVTYGMMTIAVVIISIICLLFVLGYRFDPSGGVEQRALLQLRSFPSNATIILDNAQLGFRTPGKRTVSAGNHSVVMRLDGYREWSKRVSLEPGSLLWLNYARFIPKTITTDDIRELGNFVDFEASPDRHWIALSALSANKPQLTIGDISNEAEPKFSTLKIPDEVLKTKQNTYGRLVLDEWDFGGRYLLARHIVGNQTEFLQIDRTDPSATRNISRQMKLPITKAHFAGANGMVLFVLSEGTIRKIDLGAGTISRPLVSNATDFTLYKSDTIAYTAVEDNLQKAGIYKDGNKSPRVLRTFKGTSPRAKVTISNYFNTDYAAVAHGKSVEIIKDPFNSQSGRVAASFAFEPSVKRLIFSSNGRFVLAQNDRTFATYDLEENHFAQTILQGKVSSASLQWLDDYYLTPVVNNTLRFTEFDGANQQNITSVVPDFEVTLSDNGERLFSIGKNDKGQFVLQRSRLVLNN